MWGLSVPAAGLAAGAPPEPTVAAANQAPECAVRDDVQPVAADAGTPSADVSLQPVEAEALACVACRLHETRTKVVFGVGNVNARLMFIGEGPGRDEDLKGEPFVGRAGQLLTKIIKAMGYEREDVYIANAVKCRPPQNRDPQADEVAACRHFLMRQVALIDPEIIVLLGRSAIGTVLDLHSPLSRLRGSFREWNGTKVMCTYHPAYLLRNPSAKSMVWDDMKMVRAALAGTAAD
jgi:DNA polymerase